MPRHGLEFGRLWVTYRLPMPWAQARGGPIWSCKAGNHLENFRPHLLGHTSEELGAIIPAPAHDGYVASIRLRTRRARRRTDK
jgi:hypothetical protein